MEENILTLVPETKVFKKRTVLICTFFTGPLVGGYMIAENFKSFGERQNQIRTLIVSIIVTGAIIIAMVFMPQLDKIPNIIFTLVYTSIVSACIQFLQVHKIKMHIVNGGSFYSVERAIIATIISLAITVAFAVGISYLHYYLSQ